VKVIKHYGTLGMRWGRRKVRSKSGSKKTVSKTSKIIKKISSVKKKKIFSLNEFEKELGKRLLTEALAIGGYAAIRYFQYKKYNSRNVIPKSRQIAPAAGLIIDAVFKK